MAKENNNIPTGLYWQGKRTEVERISLPFQTIETINESRATREKEKDTLLRGLKEKKDPVWHNRLIWGDNKYVMSSLIDEFAGKIDMIYIDPPVSPRQHGHPEERRVRTPLSAHGSASA